MFYRKGDRVTARKELDVDAIAAVPAGVEGRVVSTTLFGSPSRVMFEMDTVTGSKRMVLFVHRGDVG
jgi:hypothetical protein